MSERYIESPFGRVVNVHFKDNTPPPDCRSNGLQLLKMRRGNTYGQGSIIGFLNPGLITGLPFGPNQYPPFVGTWSTTEFNGPTEGYFDNLGKYGGLLHPYVNVDTGELIAPTIEAGFGQHAQQILLGAGDGLIFTNQQLLALVDDTGNINSLQEQWQVPMVDGEDCVNVTRQEQVEVHNADGTISFELHTVDNWLPFALVPDIFTIDLAWHCTSRDPADEVGLSIVHPNPLLDGGSGWNQYCPETPMFGPWSARDGAQQFTYAFHNETYLNSWAFPRPPGSRYVMDNSAQGFENAVDLNLGGPVYLIWQQRRSLGGGSYTNWSRPQTQQGTVNWLIDTIAPGALGDWYTWQVSCTSTNQWAAHLSDPPPPP